MPASGLCESTENVAAPEPFGPGQATESTPGRMALCALCGVISLKALPIRDVLTASGRGITLYADPLCIAREGETVVGAA